MSEQGAAFASKLTVVRMATVGADARLHCVPVCCLISPERALVMTGTTSKKARNVRDSGRAAVSADDSNAVRGVMIEGPARVIDDPREFHDAQEVLLSAGRLRRRREFGEEAIIVITPECWVEWGFEAEGAPNNGEGP